MERTSVSLSISLIPRCSSISRCSLVYEKEPPVYSRRLTPSTASDNISLNVSISKLPLHQLEAPVLVNSQAAIKMKTRVFFSYPHETFHRPYLMLLQFQNDAERSNNASILGLATYRTNQLVTPPCHDF
jgi:hypothetical protein